MSAASLLKVYDGLDPELAFLSAGPGGNQDLAQVLAVGASAADLAITDILSLSGGVTAPLAINSGAGEALNLNGAVNASVEATAGTLTLSAPSATGDLILALPAAKLTAVTAVAANAITAVITQQLEIKINGVAHFIPLSTVAFT